MPAACISVARFTREISPGIHFADVIGADNCGAAWNSLASFRSLFACDRRGSVSGNCFRDIVAHQAVECKGFRDGRGGEYVGGEVLEVVWEGGKSLSFISYGLAARNCLTMLPIPAWLDESPQRQGISRVVGVKFV